MARQNRNTLKQFFSSGKLPSEEDFADLIDSSLNMNDEGFTKSDDYGFHVSIENGSQGIENLISFFHKVTAKYPSWSISYDGKRGRLLFQNRDKNTAKTITVLSLDSEGGVGICNENPGEKLDHIPTRLDVAGAIRAPARIGVVHKNNTGILANGEYQDITEVLFGVQALEVVAKVSDKVQNRHAIMHAIALNAADPPAWRPFSFWNRSKRIKTHQSFFSAPKDRLKLRWESVAGENGNREAQGYKLQLKTVFDYGKDVKIEYHITRLWVNETDTQQAGFEEADTVLPGESATDD